jgi:hypothetical protein
MASLCARERQIDAGFELFKGCKLMSVVSDEQQIRKALTDFRQKLLARKSSIESFIRDEESEGRRFPELPCPPEVQAERDFIEKAIPQLEALQQLATPSSQQHIAHRTQQLKQVQDDLINLKVELEELHLTEFRKIYANSRKGLQSTIGKRGFFNHPWSEMNKMLKNKNTTMDDIYLYARKNPDSRTYALLLSSSSLSAAFSDFCAKQNEVRVKKPRIRCRW